MEYRRAWLNLAAAISLLISGAAPALAQVGTVPANQVQAGPTSGAASLPAYRAIVAADLLGVGNPGTAGALFYAASSTAIGQLSDVAVGALLASAGTGVVPAYCTACTLTTSLTVPNVYGSTTTSGILDLFATSNVSPSGSEAINIFAHNVNINANAGGASTLTLGTSGSGAIFQLYSISGSGPQQIEGQSGATGLIQLPIGAGTLATLDRNETFSGLKIFTGGITGTPSTGQASFGGNNATGAGITGNGTTDDFVLQNSANLTVCSVTHAVQALNCNQLTLTVALPIAQGGTGQTSASAAITALMPVAVRAGDVPYWNGSNWTTLAGNNSGTNVLTENPSGVPSWAAPGAGTVQSVTITGSGGNIAVGGCTITTTGSCAVQAPGGYLNVLRNNSLTAWFHGCLAAACTISPQFSVTGAVTNGGLCEITISATATFTTGEYVPVSGVAGATGCNGTFLVTVTDGTHLTLQGSVFGGTYTSGGIAGGGFCAEGVFVIPTGAAVTCQGVNTTVNSKPFWMMKIIGNTSVTDVLVRFVIESYDISLLSAGNATFQAGVINNTGGTITPTLQTKYPTAQDNWSATTTDLAATNLQSCTNTSVCTEAYTLAVSNGANTGYELNVDFGNNFSSNAKNVAIYFFDFRRDASGSPATGLNANPSPPEFRDPESDIRWNERFFQVSFDNGVAPGSTAPGGAWAPIPVAANTNTAGAGYSFRTAMRAAPFFMSYDEAGAAGKSSYLSSTGTFTNGQSGPPAASLSTGQKGFSFQPPNGTNPLMFQWTADAAITGG